MDGDTQQRLETVLERELTAAQALSETLHAERDALAGNSPEELMRHAAAKTELFDTIEQLETERRRLCAAANVDLQRAAAAENTDVNPPVADRWRALLEIIASCQVANEVNGYIINARRGHVSKLIQVLRGGTPLTYGPQGKTLATSLRALARA